MVSTGMRDSRVLDSEYVIWSRFPIYKPEPSGFMGSKRGHVGHKNQAVHGLVKSYGRAHAEWRDHILVTKRPYQGQSDGDVADIAKDWSDMTPKDVGAIKDFMVEFGNEDVDRAFAKGRKLTKGIKMTCQGDQRTFGLDPFGPVDVPLDHPVFQQEPAPISERIGFPVQLRRYEKDPVWKKEGYSPFRSVSSSSD